MDRLKKYKKKYRAYKEKYLTTRSSDASADIDLTTNPDIKNKQGQTQKQDNIQTVQDNHTINVYLPSGQEPYYGWIEGELIVEDDYDEIRTFERRGEVALYLGNMQLGEPIETMSIEEDGKFRLKLIPNYYSLSIEYKGKEWQVPSIKVIPQSTTHVKLSDNNPPARFHDRNDLITAKEVK